MHIHPRSIAIIFAVLYLMAPDTALAAGGNMPWDPVFARLIESLTGPVVRSAAIGSVVIFGMVLAFFEPGPVWRRVFQAIIGLSIAASGAPFVATLFGIGQGAAI